MRHSRRRSPRRRGAVAVFAAIIMVMLVTIVALAVDTGYMMLVRAQLQGASDSAAIAGASMVDRSHALAVREAQRFASYHMVNGKPLQLPQEAIEIGVWDGQSHEFIPVSSGGNAVRIHAKIEDGTLFFGKVSGNQFFSTSTPSTSIRTAVAIAAPRDILFVVDTSGLMNDDVEFAGVLGALKGTDGHIGRYPADDTSYKANHPLGYTSALELESRTWLDNLYEDLGWGIAPGQPEVIGLPLEVASATGAYEALVGPTLDQVGLLGDLSVPEPYRILMSDDAARRRKKCYQWIIYEQLPSLMPAALPSPSDPTNFNYWGAYLDYIIAEQVPDRTSQTYHPYDMADYANDTDSISLLRNRVGYATYLQFLLDVGSDGKIAGKHSLLTLSNPDCPEHTENTDAGPFAFPPRVEPEATVRRTLIDVVHYIDRLNESRPSDGRDRIGVITFGRRGSSQIVVPLTDHYGDAKNLIASSPQLHAKSDYQASSDAEAGLNAAQSMLLSKKDGGSGRQNATRIVLYLTGSNPDCSSSNSCDLLSHLRQHPNIEFYESSDMLPRDSALVATSRMRLKRWRVKPAGLGMGVDTDFLTRMALIQAPPNSAPPSSVFAGLTPTEYQAALKEVIKGSLCRDVSLVE